jgi:hypothetical protein
MRAILLAILLLISPAYATTTTLNSRLVPTIQYVTPSTGGTVTVNTNGWVQLLINPSGSLLALTIALPGSPSDGDIVQLCSSQAVTTLTMSGGTVIGPLTTLAIGTFATYIYSSTASVWFRIG